MNHDEFCPEGSIPNSVCMCVELRQARADEQARFEHWTNDAISDKLEAEIRADERERAAQRVRKATEVEDDCGVCEFVRTSAIAAARGEDTTNE